MMLRANSESGLTLSMQYKYDFYAMWNDAWRQEFP